MRRSETTGLLASRYPYLILLAAPTLYLLTLARDLVLGDPTEFTLVANVLGIAHPPGYAFITLAGRLFQSLIPFGSIPWRMHLLSAVSATIAAFFVYGTVRALPTARSRPLLATIAALFAALSLAWATDIWQHAIHANPHIVTATFLVANLFFLTRWWQAQQKGTDGPTMAGEKWLLAFGFAAGLGITHHPLTVFSFPAYALFLLVTRPRLLREGRTLFKMVLCALMGLAVWLYFPLRSAMEPVFGPHDLNTLDGFLNHVLARGLSESLPFYGLADQPARAVVFWSLLRLQFPLPTIALAVAGLSWLARRARRRLFLLYGLALFGNYLFVMNLRVQDIMAYLLGPFMVIALLSGAGLLAGTRWLLARQRRPGLRWAIALLLLLAFLSGPIYQMVANLPLVSLRNYEEGRVYVEQVFDFFDGREEGAVLLHDWEHMTPMWYAKYVEGRWPAPADVRPEFVSTARPWVESVFDYLGGGPVYLNSYRPEIVAAGFRLRPRGPFYEVVEPGNTSVPSELTAVDARGGEITVAGYQMPRKAVTAGDYVPLTLAFSAPLTPTHYYAPVLEIGKLSYPFTTDSHLTTPSWHPGEVIVERFDFALPHNLAAGDYPVDLRLNDLSTGEMTRLHLPLGTLQVRAHPSPPPTTSLLANFRQRVGLVAAVAGQGFSWRRAPWDEAEPLPAASGETINLLLQWESLAPAEESYTVFVHLIDRANRPLVALDYTPLGGAAPTHLWIPKWLPGQRYLDPYRLTIPGGLAPGIYYLEVGLYEMTGGRRLHRADSTGNLQGDRFILGSVLVD